MAQARLQHQRQMAIAQAALVWELPSASGQQDWVTFGVLGGAAEEILPHNEAVFEGLQRDWEGN